MFQCDIDMFVKIQKPNYVALVLIKFYSYNMKIKWCCAVVDIDLYAEHENLMVLYSCRF